MSKRYLFAVALIVSVAVIGFAGGQKQAAATKPSGPVHLVFWDMVWGPPEYITTAKALVAKFNAEHPDITVKYQSLPWNNWYQNFTTAIASGTAPDVSTGGGFLQDQIAAMGQILPLDSVIARWKSEGKLSDFFPHTLPQFQYKGHQIAIPWNTDLEGIYYRKDLFQAAGIPVPRTWAEFLSAAKKLTTANRFGYVMAGSDAMGFWQWLYWTVGNGGGVFNVNEKPDLANAKNVEALDYIRKFKAEHIIPPGTVGYSTSDAEKLFLQGKAAMILFDAQVAADLKSQAPNLYDKVGILPVLTSPNGTRLAPTGLNAIMAYKQSKHPTDAKLFLRWWSDNMAPLWTKGHAGVMPVRHSIADLPYFQQDPFAKQFIEKVGPYAVPENYPVPHAFPQMSIIDGEMTPLQAFQKALSSNESSKAILETVNKAVIKAVASGSN